ncbi:hypothetical protein ONE63_009759 [Megalurothrips usitatus]|uniref:WW domain-containing protein n=2 Tax=Megalurothrips usitatus TaxID=439358 RepID=A0AAV7XJF9_9NEOP|nr:hypothetical protein ONE63_009759 [Megalurothrips usitatus]
MDSEGDSKSKRPIRDKWTQVWSRSKPGKCYYFNVETKESSWTRPDGFVEAQGTTAPAPKETNAQRKRKQSDEALPSAKKSEIGRPLDQAKRRKSLKDELVRQQESSKSSQTNVAQRDVLADKNGGSGTGKDQVCDLKNIAGACEGQRRSDRLDAIETKRTNVVENNSGTAHSKTDAGGLEITSTVVDEVRKRKNRGRRKNKCKATVSRDDKQSATFTVSSSVKTHNATGIVFNKSTTLNNLPSVTKNENRNVPESVKNKLVNGHTPVSVSQRLTGAAKNKAHERLNELQNSLKRSHDTKKQPDIPKKDLYLTESPKILKGGVDLRPHSDTAAGSPAEKRLANFQSKLKCEQKNLLSIPATNEDCNVDAMEIEYMESEVLLDIGEYRLKEFAVEFTEQPTFMEVDVDYSLDAPNTQSLSYIVLDTNILLSHLKFVEGLRDSIIPGKGLVHLFLPWQVIHELDHLKDKGKLSIQSLARRAIDYLHGNFSSKHPRVRGQKLTEATLYPHSCPDDKILQSCIQLKDQGHDVILLSNDKNLLNKALISQVSAFSKDELSNQLNKNPSSYVSDRVVSNNPVEMTGNMFEKENIKSASQNDAIYCEMKAIIKDTLGTVVSLGMEEEYKHLWRKRTIIPPPWEADEVLHCLSSHWLSVCGDFTPDIVKSSVEQLKRFLKMNQYSVSDSDLKESLKHTKTVFESVPVKYIKTTSLGIQNIEALLKRMDKSNTPLAPDEPGCDPNDSTVLACFEDAHNAAQRLCSSSSIDPDWRQKAVFMLEAIRTLINLLTLILSNPPDSMSEEDLVLNELVNLIKGESNIMPKDLINFCKKFNNRILLENGIQQFATIELQLISMVQCST